MERLPHFDPCPRFWSSLGGWAADCRRGLCCRSLHRWPQKSLQATRIAGRCGWPMISNLVPRTLVNCPSGPILCRRPRHNSTPFFRWSSPVMVWSSCLTCVTQGRRGRLAWFGGRSAMIFVINVCTGLIVPVTKRNFEEKSQHLGHIWTCWVTIGDWHSEFCEVPFSQQFSCSGMESRAELFSSQFPAPPLLGFGFFCSFISHRFSSCPEKSSASRLYVKTEKVCCSCFELCFVILVISCFFSRFFCCSKGQGGLGSGKKWT